MYERTRRLLRLLVSHVWRPALRYSDKDPDFVLVSRDTARQCSRAFRRVSRKFACLSVYLSGPWSNATLFPLSHSSDVVHILQRLPGKKSWPSLTSRRFHWRRQIITFTGKLGVKNLSSEVQHSLPRALPASHTVRTRINNSPRQIIRFLPQNWADRARPPTGSILVCLQTTWHRRCRTAT